MPKPTEHALGAWATSRSGPPLVRAACGFPNDRKIVGEGEWRARSRTTFDPIHQSRSADTALKRLVRAPDGPEAWRKLHVAARPSTRQGIFSLGAAYGAGLLIFALGILVAQNIGYSATVAGVAHFFIAAAISVSYAMPALMFLKRTGSASATAGIPRGTAPKAGSQVHQFHLAARSARASS